MPGIADKSTQSAQSRLLWPGMTSFALDPHPHWLLFESHSLDIHTPHEGSGAPGRGLPFA